MKTTRTLLLLAVFLLLVVVSESERSRPAGVEPVPAVLGGGVPFHQGVAQPSPRDMRGKPILVLQTRHHQITVYGGARSPIYTVRSERGMLLAQEVDEAVLKARFPGLYEVVTGVAWGETHSPTGSGR